MEQGKFFPSDVSFLGIIICWKMDCGYLHVEKRYNDCSSARPLSDARLFPGVNSSHNLSLHVFNWDLEF